MKKKTFDSIIIIFVIIGLILSFTSGEGTLISKGIDNFKYYTVLSNVLCGVVALIRLICKKTSEKIRLLKYTAAGVVTVTFLTILLFLGPLYGYSNMYKNANLWFHLIIPIVALIDIYVTDAGPRFKIKTLFLTTIPTVIYGTVYLANNLINGVGTWPNTNDWYGFLNWGLPVGILIFAVITAVNFVVVCVLQIVISLRKNA